MCTHLITIWRERLVELARTGNVHRIVAAGWDDGDAYTIGAEIGSAQSVPGSVHFVAEGAAYEIAALGAADDRFRLVASRGGDDRAGDASIGRVKGYVPRDGTWLEVRVQAVPVREELFSRLGGLLETGVLSDKRVLLLGLGSGGSFIAVELAKSGVGRFDLIDHDRYEVGNNARHIAPIGHVGRLKVRSMADLIRAKNPYAGVNAWPVKIGWDQYDFMTERVREADLVICATGDRTSRMVANKVCVDQDKPLIDAGCYRRARGGQVQRILPRRGPCHQCFVETLPEQASDQEVASAEQADGLAYTDRPVPIEPGLSNDIAPISVMAVKLAIQELLRGHPTSLASLDEDLVASLFIYMNRREPGTLTEKWAPLEFNIGGMHVLRWYGVRLERNLNCPVCGDHPEFLALPAGPDLSPETINEFVATTAAQCPPKASHTE